MSPEDRSLLESTHRLAQENNKILHSIRRNNRYATIFKVVYWVIIIGVSLGAFYFIQPYVESILNVYRGVQGDAAAAHNAVTSIQSLLHVGK
jgi:hypothetical protein